MTELELVDETERIRVGVALETALRNAICCGNLELDASWPLDRCREPAATARRPTARSASARPRRRIAIAMPGSKRGCRNGGRSSRSVTKGRASIRGSISRRQPRRGPARYGPDGWLLVKSMMDAVVLSADGRQLILTKRRQGDSR